MAARAWWQEAVFYQIYPRSFADSTGSGVGDLAGISEHLDDLAWLGIDALWLSPFFRSPMADFGYDVADYCDVDPLFGSLADFDILLAGAHERGLKVIIDWVPSHSSSEHPWFLEARASRGNPKRDWYLWRDPGPNGELPNNWLSTLTGGAPAWTLDEGTGQLYLHSFLPEQPDLNWENPELRAAMYDTLRFWLDRGVDGFRIDVVHNMGKNPELPDVEPGLAKLPHSVLNDEPATHEYLREIRRLLDGYPGDRTAVGEVFLLDTAKVATYHGRGDELPLCFNFPAFFAPWQAEAWRERVDDARRLLGARDAWPTWVLSNHDFQRHRTRFGGSEARARAAAVLLLSLRGTPFLYMGEELGLQNAEVPDDRLVDPGGRDGCRAPIPWFEADGHGWPRDAWLPFPPEAGARSWQCQREDSGSFLHLYRRLLAARRASPALRAGSFEWLDPAEGSLAWRRLEGGDERVVIVCFEGETRLALGGDYVVEVASDGLGEGERFDGGISADRGLVLKPL
jgi:alpha-glucosidase